MAKKNALEKYEPTAVGIALPDNLAFREWQTLFDGYSFMAKNIPWVIGDLLVYGETHYGEDVGQALDGLMARTQYAQGTIYNLVYVSRHVSPHVRNPNLSHGIHYEVAKMDQGDQVEWLTRAELEGWTVGDLRKAIKGERPQRKIEVKEVEEAEEKPKPKTSGRINDSFDLWWDKYSSGMGYGDEEKKIAMDAWNASVT